MVYFSAYLNVERGDPGEDSAEEGLFEAGQEAQVVHKEHRAEQEFFINDSGDEKWTHGEFAFLRQPQHVCTVQI